MRRAAGTALAAIAVIDQVVFSCIHTKPIAHSLSTHISAELASLTAHSSTLHPQAYYCEHFITLRAITYIVYHRDTPPRTHRCAVLAVYAFHVGCLMRHVRSVDHCGRAGQCSAQSEAEAAPAHRLTHLHHARQLPCTAAARSDERRRIRS